MIGMMMTRRTPFAVNVFARGALVVRSHIDWNDLISNLRHRSDVHRLRVDWNICSL
jgi:hypothetical protein